MGQSQISFTIRFHNKTLSVDISKSSVPAPYQHVSPPPILSNLQIPTPKLKSFSQLYGATISGRLRKIQAKYDSAGVMQLTGDFDVYTLRIFLKTASVLQIHKRISYTANTILHTRQTYLQLHKEIFHDSQSVRRTGNTTMNVQWSAGKEEAILLLSLAHLY